MLVAAAFVPSAPLLLEALGGGPGDLRSACHQAISVLDAVERIVVIGAAEQAGWLSGTIDATPYGAAGVPVDEPLSLAHAVGATLLEGRPHDVFGVTRVVGPSRVFGLSEQPNGRPSAAVHGPTGFLVVADGSARRTEKAPGHLDPRAEVFDAQVENAVLSGDLDALLVLDAVLADELLVGGLAAWTMAAGAARDQVRPDGAAPGGWSGAVHYAAAPYGVGYLVGSWTPRQR